MKFDDEGKRAWIARAPVLAIAGFSIFVLVQNGCSNSVVTDAPDAGSGGGTDAAIGGCFPGETMQAVGSGMLCCSGTPPTLVCHGPGSRAGDPCTPNALGPPVEDTLLVTLDVCVTDSCNGDHTPTTFDAKIVDTATLLACTDGTFVAGKTSTHEVDRGCIDVAPLSCPNTTYSYAYGGYVSGYGVSYYGGQELRRRDVGLLSSTCVSNGNPPQTCDVAGL